MDEAPAPPPETRIRGLEQQVEQLAGEVQHYRKLYTDQLTRCALLERGIIAGRKAERVPEGEQVEQLSMQLLGMMFGALQAEPTAQGDEGRSAEPEVLKADEPLPDSSSEPTSRPRPTGRKRPPEALPRIVIEVIPEDVQRQGLDAFVRIGEKASEVIERRRGSLVVVRLVRPKFVRKGEAASEPAHASRASRAAPWCRRASRSATRPATRPRPARWLRRAGRPAPRRRCSAVLCRRRAS